MNKNLMKSVLALTVVGVFGLQSAQAAPNYQTTKAPVVQSQNDNQLKGSVVYTPVGITAPALTSMPISSETLYQGAAVNATLPAAITYNGKTIAPAGSMITGSAIMVKKAGRATQNGQVYVRFNAITTPQGFRIPVSAIIKTTDNSGLLKGGSKVDITKAYAKDVAVGAGAGALAGLVASAVSGGEKGKATAIMTGVGATAGLGKSLLDKGVPVEIPANSQIEIYFDQPITVGAPNGYNY